MDIPEQDGHQDTEPVAPESQREPENQASDVVIGAISLASDAVCAPHTRAAVFHCIQHRPVESDYDDHQEKPNPYADKVKIRFEEYRSIMISSQQVFKKPEEQKSYRKYYCCY